MSTNLKGLGHKPSPSWVQFPHVTKLLGKKQSLVGAGLLPPPGASLRPFQFIQNIRDQGSTESCVGQALAAGLELTSRAYNYNVPDVSALFNYWLARIGEHPVTDEGSNPFNAIANIAKFGIVADTKWPFDSNKINSVPSLDCWTDALKHKITGIFSTYGTEVDTIKQCLDNGYPVCFAQQVDDQFDNYKDGAILGKFDGTSRGGHYTVLVDYTDQYAVGLNSWGSSWGSKYGKFQGGFFFASWNRLADPINCSEFLVIDTGPTDLI